MVRKIYSVGIYSRLSVEGSDRKNESIQTQIEIAKEYIKGQEDMILYDCYSDLGKTGTDFAREGFERLMADVRLRRVDCVIVKDFSRFGRNYIETGNYIQKIFPFLGVRFVSVTDGFDSLFSKNDDIGVNLKNLANEMYARDIALKVKSSKRAKREAGSYTGGVPPYGYRADWICGKKCLSVEAGTAEVVKWIYDRYDEGRSLKEIAAELYAQEIHRPTEYRRYNHLRRQPGEALCEWPRTSIKAILTNLVYTGCMVLGDTGGNDAWQRLKGGLTGSGEAEDSGIRSGEAEEGGTGSGEAEDSGIRSGEAGSNGTGSIQTEYGSVKEGAHEAIVSREQFCRIAKRFDERSKKTKWCGSGKNRNAYAAEISGVLFCGCCGKRLGRRCFAKHSDSGHKVISCSYFCRNSKRIDDFHCDTGIISGEVLTEMVNTVLRQEAALNNILPEELVRENMRYVRERKDKIMKDIGAINKRLRAADWEGSEQYRKYREGIISRGAFLEWKAQNEKEAEKEREGLEKEKRRLCAVDAEAERQSILLREVTAFSGRPELEGGLISALIQGIRLYPGKRVEITFRFAAQDFTGMAGAGDGSGQKI